MKNIQKNLRKFGVMFFVFYFVSGSVFASTTDGTITTGGSDGFAWATKSGYVNFGHTSGNVRVTDSAITGHVWDVKWGWINLGPITASGTTQGVSNTPEGVLGGYAWSPNAGWVPFSGARIDVGGVFRGQTTSASSYGFINFDCTYCRVATDWRPLSIRLAQAGAAVLSGSSGVVVAMASSSTRAPDVVRVTNKQSHPGAAVREPLSPGSQGEAPSKTEDDSQDAHIADLSTVAVKSAEEQPRTSSKERPILISADNYEKILERQSLLNTLFYVTITLICLFSVFMVYKIVLLKKGG